MEIGEKVITRKADHPALDYGIPEGSVGKIVGFILPHIVKVQNPSWSKLEPDGVLVFFTSELEVCT